MGGLFIGDNRPYHDHDFESGESGAAFNPMRPLNDSPNNTGISELPPTQPAFIWYPYGASELFPAVGQGGRNAMAGPVFYYDDYEDAPARFPEYYDGKLFIYDWMRGWIMAVTMYENGDYVRLEPFLPASTFYNPIDMLFAPDGSMYLLEYGPLWFNGSPEARLSHITHLKGNLTPVAGISVDQQIGAVPFSLTFTSDAIDYDRDALQYQWDFGDGTTSTDVNPTHTYETPGTYEVVLTVEDPDGAEASANLEILAGNAMPEVAIQITGGNRSFYWENAAISYTVDVIDEEDGSLIAGTIDPAQVTFTIDYLERGADLVMPALGHQAALDASRSVIGKNLIDNANCSACHQPEEASVGPSYLSIANRYGASSSAPTSLGNKIIQGGSGVWGNTAMPPHPHLTLSETEKMTEYILSLGGHETASPGAPLTGVFTQKEHVGKGEEGSYILTATYTDQGGASIGPLTARSSIALRHPRIMAADFDASETGIRFQAPEDAPGGLGGTFIYLGNHGAVATYEDIDLTDVSRIKAIFGVVPSLTTGGWIDVRLDAPDGPLLGTFEAKLGLTNVGGVEVELDIEPRDSTHDLYFVYRNKQEEGLVCVGILFDFVHVNEVAS